MVKRYMCIWDCFKLQIKGKKKKRKKTIKKNHFPLTEVFAIKTIVAVGSILLEPK